MYPEANIWSAFHCSHAAETALLKVLNYLRFYLNESRALMCIGLDLSAVSDIIDNQFLFEILNKKIGLHHVVSLFTKCFPSN